MTGSSESFVVLNRYLPFLATKFESPDLKPVHRLDKTTSGILLMAKTEERYEDLKRLFKDRRIDKTYWAIVRGVPEPSQGNGCFLLARKTLICPSLEKQKKLSRFIGIINIPLAETSFEGKYRMTVSPDYSEFNRRDRNKGERDVWRKKTNPKRKEVFPAVTEYKVLRSNVHMSLLEVKPITGYTHQIRAHLGLGLGCPVLGDHKYSDVTRIDRPQVL